MVKERPLYRKNGALLATMMRRGYTMKALARATDVHYMTIWRIVNREHRPRPATAARIAEVLQATPRELGLEVWHGRGGAESK